MLNSLRSEAKSNLTTYFIYTISTLIAIVIPIFASHYVNSVYDTTYFVTNGLRIAEGQIPYKDFILVHNPGSFLIIGMLFKIFGTSYFSLVGWMIFVQIFSMIFTFVILNHFISIKYLRLFFAFLSAFTMPYSVVAANNYDSDSTFFILFCLAVLLRNFNKPKPKEFVLLGFLTFVIFIIKQNVGGFFILAMILIIFKNYNFKIIKYFALGLSICGTIFFCFLYLFSDIANWWRYGVVFAAQQRLGDPFGPVKKIFDSSTEVKEILIAAVISILAYSLSRNLKQQINFPFFAFPLILAVTALIKSLINFMRHFSTQLPQIEISGWGGSLYYTTVNQTFWLVIFLAVPILLNRPLLKNSKSAVILICVTTLYSALLSQGINGSTYGNSILFVLIPMLLVGDKSKTLAFKMPKKNTKNAATIIRIERKIFRSKAFEKINLVTFVTFITLFAITFGITGLTNGRLGFVDLRGEVQRNSSIQWIGNPGSFLPEQNYARDILKKYNDKYDGIVFIPGAEFGYLLSGIAPTADVHTFDGTTNPYGADQQFFLECNKVQLVAYNSHNSVSMYFDFNVSKWPPPSNYSYLERVGPFDLYVRKFETKKFTSKGLCPTTSKFYRENGSNG